MKTKVYILFHILECHNQNKIKESPFKKSASHNFETSERITYKMTEQSSLENLKNLEDYIEKHLDPEIVN